MNRRELLNMGACAAAGMFAYPEGFGLVEAAEFGRVAGFLPAAEAGSAVLKAGGNAVDAIVTAALTAAVVAPHNTGIGGYGGHMTIAKADGSVTSIDYNTIAPARARAEMFPLDESGKVRDNANVLGWLAAGVPGILAGMQLALERYGTVHFREAVQPAIRYAEEGFPVPAGVATILKNNAAHFRRDPGTAALLLPDGEPLKEGELLRNLPLARTLKTLAERNSVESFYRGDIAKTIAAAFQNGGGLVTASDLAAYRAREVDPIPLAWRGYVLYTAPLTAGGISIVQMLNVLKALGWEKRASDDPQTTQALLEAMRLAWTDRVTLLGDPEQVKVPEERLLSDAYAGQLAQLVDKAVKEKKPSPARGDGRTADGTIHLSAVDGKGMMAALTLTHGSSFGAQVTVPELGLTLGHGMSRFEPHPRHPNAPGPGKRPLHNMCPSVVLKDGKPVMALGGAGGRKIVNSLFQVLAQCLGRDTSIDAALAAPRLHCEGDLNVTLDLKYAEADEALLKSIGYQIKRAQAGANVNAVTRVQVSGVPC